jgi:hypothetical protein
VARRSARDMPRIYGSAAKGGWLYENRLAVRVSRKNKLRDLSRICGLLVR